MNTHWERALASKSSGAFAAALDHGVCSDHRNRSGSESAALSIASIFVGSIGLVR